MFSDKFRVLKIFSCILLLIIMGLWNLNNSVEIKLSDCLADPAAYNLTELKIANDAVILNVKYNSFTILSRGNTIPVKITGNQRINESAVGRYISLAAVYHKEGYLEMKKYHVHYFRRIKMLVSVIIAAIISIIFLLNYRFDFKKLVFEEKKCRT
ncbi:hypothetical protein ACFLUV_05510 [Elusimicrobiota bacterium]